MVWGSMSKSVIVNEPAGRKCLFAQKFQEQMEPLVVGIVHS